VLADVGVELGPLAVVDHEGRERDGRVKEFSRARVPHHGQGAGEHLLNASRLDLELLEIVTLVEPSVPVLYLKA